MFTAGWLPTYLHIVGEKSPWEHKALHHCAAECRWSIRRYWLNFSHWKHRLILEFVNLAHFTHFFSIQLYDPIFVNSLGFREKVHRGIVVRCPHTFGLWWIIILQVHKMTNEQSPTSQFWGKLKAALRYRYKCNLRETSLGEKRFPVILVITCCCASHRCPGLWERGKLAGWVTDRHREC